MQRRSKRMKFARLEGWGEMENEVDNERSSQKELPDGWIQEKSMEKPFRGLDGVVQMESFDELFEKKKSGKEIATERKRNKLSNKEVSKYSKSNHNVFD